MAGQTVENCIYDIWLPSTDVNNPATILVIEQALAALGYPVGPIDGVLDVATMAAIAQWQADNGFPPDGLPNADQMFSGLLFPDSSALPSRNYNPDNDWDCHQVLITPAPVPRSIPPWCLSSRWRGQLPPDLEIKKDQLLKNCLPGELCQFKIVLINHGPGEWTGTPVFEGHAAGRLDLCRQLRLALRSVRQQAHLSGPGQGNAGSRRDADHCHHAPDAGDPASRRRELRRDRHHDEGCQSRQQPRLRSCCHGRNAARFSSRFKVPNHGDVPARKFLQLSISGSSIADPVLGPDARP